MPHLISTTSGELFPFGSTDEFTADGESLDVYIPSVEKARVKSGTYIWERFSDFLPFSSIPSGISLGEGNTPLINANRLLREYTGLNHLYLKNETVNPTWSFKDRGSLTNLMMAVHMNEKITATISTGNMGHSMAAYSAHAGVSSVIFVPHFTPDEKLRAMAVHGARMLRIHSPDYAELKSTVLQLAATFQLRIVSGNNPVRVEGYKLCAFEMFEQMTGEVPDYIVVPTSACGHIRGLFKGYMELLAAGYIKKLPKMVIAQAFNNSPLVSAIKQGAEDVVPYKNFHTIAGAITSGNPQGGREIILKARKYGWLAENATEDEMLNAQQRIAAAGFFVEPASAAGLTALKKLVQHQQIPPDASVVLMLTGSGLKDMMVFKHHKINVMDSEIHNIEYSLDRLLKT